MSEKYYAMVETNVGSYRAVGILFVILFIILIPARLMMLKNDVPDDIYFSSEETMAMEFKGPYSIKIEPGTNLRFLGLCDDEIWCEFQSKSGQTLRGMVKFSKDQLRFSDGLTFDDAMNYMLPKEHGLYYSTLESIMEEAIGKSFDDIEKKWRKATYAFPWTSGDYSYFAYFTMIGVLGEKGELYNVEMSFDENRTCTGVKLWDKARNRNCWFLSNMPLAHEIASQGWIMMNVQDPIYRRFVNHGWQWKFLALILHIWSFMAWIVLPIFFPFFLVTFLISSTNIFRGVSDTILQYLGLIFSCLFAYVWSIPLLCWGFYGLLLFPVIAYVLIVLAKVSKEVVKGSETVVPLRCPICKEANGLRFQEKKSLKVTTLEERHRDPSRKVYPETVRYEKVKVLVKSKYTYPKYPDRYDEEIRMMSLPVLRDRIVNTYHNYTITYRVEDFESTFRCKNCGHIERHYTTEKTEISRTDNSTTKREDYSNEYFSEPESDSHHVGDGVWVQHHYEIM